MVDGTRMQQRRGLASDWDTANPILSDGELGVTTDTGIIKIGDGVSHWADLDAAFGSQYLPILGTAFDSNQLGGISAAGFVQIGSVDTAASNNTIAKRLSDGRLKATNGSASDDVVSYSQLQTAITTAKSETIGRSVTAAFTLALTDAFTLVNVGNSSYTEFAATIPPNSSVAFPVGSYIDFVTTDKGPVRITPGSGVTLSGPPLLYGPQAVNRVIKTATDSWLITSIRQMSTTMLKLYVQQGQSLANGTHVLLNLNGSDSAAAASCKIVDTVGANAQFDFSGDTTKAFCRRGGHYEINAQLCVTGTTTGRMFCEIYVNGVAQHIGSGGPRGSVAEPVAHANGKLLLQVGDYVQMYGYQDSGSAQTVSNNNYAASFFEWTHLRPQ